MNPQFWRGRRVFLTGHTGFKGSWLCLWLNRLGAHVTGYALAPPTTPSLYEACNIASVLEKDIRADLLDAPRLRDDLISSEPDIVVHMAAQALVREGYRDPVVTFATNLLGTVHLLDAVRHAPSVRAALIITTDKCYANREWVHPYRESDELGGADPYSASKACAEIATHAWRSSFAARGSTPHPAIATVRAGNVIGGGDWAVDRLIPDCIRAFTDRTPVVLRYPQAVRPWQHVLEPLAGYLTLAERLAGETPDRFAGAWNFGPDTSGEATVRDVAQGLARIWGSGAEVRVSGDTVELHESGLLRLDSTKAQVELGWRPRFTLTEALTETARWYDAAARGDDLTRLTLSQIDAYAERLT